MSTFRCVVAIMAMGLPLTTPAQTTGGADPQSPRVKQQIEVSAGLLSGLNTASEVSVGGVSMTSEANAIIESIGYGHWLTDDWAVVLSLGVSSADVSTFAAVGSPAGLGMELSLSRRFTLGLAVGYRLVSDSERRIGSETNHSSPEFSLSLGVLIGRATE